MAAGGGYGKPLERAPELIEDDLRQGFVSPEAAARDYGYRPAEPGGVTSARLRTHGPRPCQPAEGLHHVPVDRERRAMVRAADAPLRLCGRLIAKHLLVADAGGERQIFCSEGCEQLYRDYVLVERGRDFRPPADVGERYEDRMVK